MTKARVPTTNMCTNSEDNASFTDLLEKANIKTKLQNKWFFDRESQPLRISNTETQETNEKAPSGCKYKARNALMYFPEGHSESWVNDHDGRALPKAIAHENTHVINPVEVKIHT